MPTRNDMTGGTIYFSTADSPVKQVFNGLTEVTFSCGGEDVETLFYPLTVEFTATVKMTNENKAVLLGFKNYNCYSRFIRRMKRREEQERRRRLKEGSFHA